MYKKCKQKMFLTSAFSGKACFYWSDFVLEVYCTVQSAAVYAHSPARLTENFLHSSSRN